MRHSGFFARWLVLFVALLSLAMPGRAALAQTADPAIEKAVAYIRTQQQPDGSFSGIGAGSTADAIFALSAAGVNVAEVKQGGKSAVDYIRTQAKGSGKDTGVAAKYVIAMLLAGQSPLLPDGTDLVAEVESGRKANGQYGADVTAHAYALIALNAAGAPAAKSPESVGALKALQLPDGGWSFDGTAASGSDTNTTAVAIQALVAVGERGDALSRALAYLKTQQNSDGGFPYSQASQFGTASDANSTALSYQAIVAAGEDLGAYTKGGNTPAARLLAFQNGSGAFRYQDATPDDNTFATYQAVPALVARPLPLEGIVIALPATPAEAPAPSTPAAGGPATLPNTGGADMLPAFAVAALALMLAGLAVRRRQA